MKLLFPLAFISLLFLISCNDDDLKPKDIQGTWELESSFNGWTGEVSYPAGNGSKLKFGKNNYQIFSKDTLAKSGTYEITKATRFLTKEEGDQIIYDGNMNDIRTFVELKNGQLILSIDAYDAGYVAYKRIK